MSEQCTPLWSPELYALGVPPVWAVWALLLWGADYYEWSGRYGRPCLADYQALPCTEAAGHWRFGLGLKRDGCRAPGNPRASAGPWVGRAQSVWLVAGPVVPDQASACQCMGPVPDMADCGI